MIYLIPIVSGTCKGPANLKKNTADFERIGIGIDFKLELESLSVSLPTTTRLFDYYYGRCVQCTYELITHN